MAASSTSGVVARFGALHKEFNPGLCCFVMVLGRAAASLLPGSPFICRCKKCNYIGLSSRLDCSACGHPQCHVDKEAVWKLRNPKQCPAGKPGGGCGLHRRGASSSAALPAAASLPLRSTLDGYFLPRILNGLKPYVTCLFCGCLRS